MLRTNCHSLFHQTLQLQNQNGHLPNTEPPPSLIDEQFINSARQLVEEKYLECLDSGLNKTTEITYGNLHIKIPFQLSQYIYFYDEEKICDTIRSYEIGRSEAISNYVSFMRQYNLALIKFFEAINGSKVAEADFMRYFTGDGIFKHAGMTPGHLYYVSDPIKKSSFTLALLAYLLLDIVFSQEESLSVESRIAAIQFVKKHFNITKVAEAFQEYRQGYELSAGSSRFGGPVPKKFLADAAANNTAFDTNPEMVSMFRIAPATKELLLESGIEVLIIKHPKETAQVLLGLLQMDSYYCPCKIDKAKLFEKIIKLTELGNLQQFNILSTDASYCNEGYSPPDLRKWAIEKTKIVNIEHYVDLKVLASLPGLRAKQIFLESMMRIYDLEKQLVAMEASQKIKDEPKTDEYNSYALLQINKESHGEGFQAKLEMHFRVVSAGFDVTLSKGRQQLLSINAAYLHLKSFGDNRITVLEKVYMNGHTNGHTNGHVHHTMNGLNGMRVS